MSETHTPQAEQDVVPPASKPYASPELVEHGSIDALTAGGEREVLANSVTGESEEPDTLS